MSDQINYGAKNPSQTIKIGDRIRNNERNFEFRVLDLNSDYVWYQPSSGPIRRVQRAHINFDGKERHRHYNWVGRTTEAPEVPSMVEQNKQKLLGSTSFTPVKDPVKEAIPLTEARGPIPGVHTLVAA